MSAETTLANQGRKTWTYPHSEFARLYAPLEKIHPAVKLRALLRSKFIMRRTEPESCYLLTAGAYDAMTAALLTELGFEAVYASGWQLAAAHSMSADVGVYPSHAMAGLVSELLRGVESARDRHFFETEGETLQAPPVFADMETGFGGPAQAFSLARELIRAGAAGVHLEDQDPAERGAGRFVSHRAAPRPKVLLPTRKWIEKLIAVKAAAQAAESELVIIARTDAMGGVSSGGREGSVEHAIDRALEAASLGVDVIWPEFCDTSAEAPRLFAEGVHKHYPDQMLGFNLSAALHWGQAKREGRIPTNRELGQMGYVLQFSSLLAFRTAGMALETWLKGFRQRGLDALADLQLVEVASLDGEPRTRTHQRFAGAHRWSAFERIARGSGEAAM